MGEETVRQVSTTDIHAVEKFVAIERNLLGGYPLYVSNFDTDVIRNLSGKSAITREMEISLFIASDRNSEVARCAAIINPEYQEAKKEQVGFIGYFAAAPNCEISVSIMLEQAEDWLRDRGIKRVIAPYNGNALHGMGFLISAFNENPVIAFNWNPAYYPAYFTQDGYRPAYPLWVYEYDFKSEKYLAAKESYATENTYDMRPINKKRWNADLEIFREVINETFTQEWEWYPISSEGFLEVFATLKPMVDSHQMMIAELHGKVVAVCIGFPNWNPFIRELHGKLGIVQQIKFLLRGGNYSSGGIAFIAVKSDYRGKGIGPLLELCVLQRYEELGTKKAFIYTINDVNQASRKSAEKIGGIARLLYHAYDKIL